MLLKRWITSLVALPFLILLIWQGGALLFTLVIAAVSLLGLWEYFRILFADHRGATVVAMRLAGTVCGPAIVFSSYLAASHLLLLVLALGFIFAGGLAVVRFKDDARVPVTLAQAMLGIVYVPVLLSSLVVIRTSADGVTWIFLVLAMVFAGDVAAFFIGSRWGRYKLCPAVSPGKTVEGAVGGLAASVAVGAFFQLFFLPPHSWLPALVCFMTVGAVGQVGDLFESVLKRSAGVKDSGNLLPGHGGILDRIDALLFAAPMALLFKEVLLR
jgi:phosphatidate cytidylyltransferase